MPEQNNQIDRKTWRQPVNLCTGILFALLAGPPLSAQTDTTLPILTIRDARFDQTGFSAWRGDSLPVIGVMSLSERLLWENPLSVRANGPGLLSTISARGAGPSRTPLFWNGLNLQSPQNGVVDASLFPVWAGDRLEVRYGGQSAAQSSGAMGGAVFVEPEWNIHEGFSGQLGGAIGSFGRKEFMSGLGYSNSVFSSRIRINGQAADNDFPFKNTVRIGQPEVEQQNNRMDKLDIQQFNRLVIGDRDVVKTALWRLGTFREIPPAMSEAPTETWQRDRAIRAITTWEHSRDTRSLLQSRMAWVDEAIFFRFAGVVDSSRARTALFSSEYSAVSGKRITWKAGGTVIRQWAQAAGYGDPDRWYTQNRLAGFGMFEYRLPWGRITALLRQEWAEKQAAPFTCSLGGQVGWGGAGALRFHLSRNFNLPTFNDRFWLALGNPGLRPEKGYSGDMGWVYQKKAFTLEATAFHLLLDDWILWEPGADGLFRPENLRKVWSRGVETAGSFNVEMRKVKFRLSARYQYVRATSIAVYNGNEAVLHKQLVYTPSHSGSVVLRMEKGNASLAYLHQLTGNRFTTSDNSTSLEGFQSGTLLTTFRIPLKSMILAMDARLENIWNVPYQVIEDRPMPGRNWRIGATFFW